MLEGDEKNLPKRVLRHSDVTLVEFYQDQECKYEEWSQYGTNVSKVPICYFVYSTSQEHFSGALHCQEHFSREPHASIA